MFQTAVISFGQAQPKLDLNTEILARQEANRTTISTKKLIDDEERTNLLPKQEDS